MRAKRKFVLVGLLAGCASLACAQRLPQMDAMTPGNLTPSITLTPPFTPVIRPVTPAAPCTRFVEPFDVDDYNGPLHGLVARVSQRVNSATVQMPQRHSPRPCGMDAHDKFGLFLKNTADPLNLVGAAWDATTSQIAFHDAAYGSGMKGFGRRYSASLTDSAASEFFGTFLYPSIFHQDPRYYRMGHGTVNQRLMHAVAHRFVARSDSGKRMFNYSEWMTTVSMKALTNVYHPENPRGFAPTASRVGFSVANDVGWDILREFWPGVARKFHLPFRTHEEVVGVAPSPTPLRVPIRPAVPASPVADQPLLDAAR